MSPRKILSHAIRSAGFYSDALGLWGNSKHWGCRRWVSGVCLRRGPGAEPLVRGSGGQSPPEAGNFLLRKYLIFVCIGSYCGKTTSLLYVCNDDRNCMNCVYTVNHNKVAAHLCHNIGKSGSIFRIFALLMQEEIFKHV